MTPLMDDERLAKINADLKRALVEGDPDVLAGRFSPKPPEEWPTAAPRTPAAARAETGRKRVG